MALRSGLLATSAAMLLSSSTAHPQLRSRSGSRAAPSPSPTRVLTPEPVIGILTVPLQGAEQPCDTVWRRYATERGGALALDATSYSCFTAFYSQWIAASGGRAVVIPYNLDADTLSQVLQGVNGVLFTGGGLDLTFGSPYVNTAQRIFRAVQAMNDNGDFFPLHGTCMGMQLLSILAAGNESVLQLNAFDSENISWPLQFTATGVQSSRLFGQAPPDIVQIFATQNLTENLHHDGVPPTAYFQNAPLHNFFNLISTNTDRRGNAFVSTMEAFNYPITATQWHVERPQFEHSPNIGLDHSYDAIRAMQYVGNFFIQEARMNGHQFTNATLLQKLSLYSYTPFSVGDIMDGYQAYLINY